MIVLICSESFLSIAAMIASMLLTASSEISLVPTRACSARVLTAVSIASLARSVLGLNSFLRRESKALISIVSPAPAWACGLVSAMGSGLLRLGLGGRRQ